MEIKKIVTIAGLLVAITTFGVIGYHFIEGWNLIDSFYMTIITLTTTGFGEVHKLSTPGRFFTTFLLIVGIGVFTYSVSTLFSALLSINFKHRRRKKMDKKIQGMQNHTIICGFGRMGKVICQELAHAGHDNFVIIEQNHNLITDLEKSKYLWIEGNAANDEILLQAGIRKAKVLVSMIDNDADGLYLSLAARSFNAKIYLIIRANHEIAKSRILKTGADRVILPYVMSGHKVAQSILNPAIEDLLDIAGIKTGDNQTLQIVDIPVDKYQLVNKTLKTCGFRRDGLIIVGVKKEDKRFIFAPNADYPFSKGDCLIAMGTKESYEDIIKHLLTCSSN